ncbi:Hypothetical protein HDN1F_14160 [gamma proteobacterium HdN1]|nr:Hypothetical protein HDN1F_14160 [gamma proteobacterium HdN1]
MLAPTLNNASLQSFAENYTDARTRFLTILQALPTAYNHRALPCIGQAPNGESLYTDTVWIGPADASSVLVLISATHGVEGFAGSAIQIDLLQRLQVGNLPNNFAILIIHALNPWGFAWLRRCDHEGIDLNRNFINSYAPPPSNSGYTELATALIPTDGDWQSANQRLSEFAAQHGQRAYEIAVSGGQYSDPAGMFFGGLHASQARHHIEALIAEHQLSERALAVIDLHTGLGPFGYGEIICDHPHNTRGAEVAALWYGEAVTLPDIGSSSSVPKSGLLDYAWHAIMNTAPNAPAGCFVTLEFGTYPVDNLFNVLRHDHALHAQRNIRSNNDTPDWQARAAQANTANMRRHFYPGTQAWQAMVLFQGRQTIDMAIRGLVRE